jgi:hypothetical protein
MEAWRKSWRDGIAPSISTAGLEALAVGLAGNDRRLIQGQTTEPPPLQCVQDWPLDGADAIGYAAWIGDGLATVGEVEEFFARTCYEADVRLQEPAGCRWWLNAWDETPRQDMFALALVEVMLALHQRRVSA